MELTINNPYRDEHYVIRVVPIHDAIKLRDAGIVFYDYTKLTAINTCPTWGLLRYALHRTEIPLTASGRKLALECGSACHDYFAALRMWTLRKEKQDQVRIAGFINIWNKHGRQLFGEDRWKLMLDAPQDADPTTNAINFALVALHESGYYDDPSDRKRTMANMEAACINYTDRYFKSVLPVYVGSDGLIGIEVPFVLEVKCISKDIFGESITNTQYYCGRIDGIHQRSDSLVVAENKTAASLSAAWRTSFALSHQVTGYTIAGSVLTGQHVSDAIVMGTQIPIPRDVYNGVAFESATRTTDDVLRWCEWFFDSIATYEKYITQPTQAPRYSHSCNRFFSSCEFIPYCAATRDEQASLIEEMRVDEWSPLDHQVDGIVT